MTVSRITPELARELAELHAAAYSAGLEDGRATERESIAPLAVGIALGALCASVFWALGIAIL